MINNDYKKIYNYVVKGKIYKNINYSKSLLCFIKRLGLYNSLNDEVSNVFLEKIMDLLDILPDVSLIDDNLLRLLDLNNTNILATIETLQAILLSNELSSSYLGTYLESFNYFLYHDLLPKEEIDIKDINNKLQLLYYYYNLYKEKSKSFDYSCDYELPFLLFAYYYANDLDMNDINDILELYKSNKDYYYDKMYINGIYFPYSDDDTIPKYYYSGYEKIFNSFIPNLIDDYKKNNKKRIK